MTTMTIILPPIYAIHAALAKLSADAQRREDFTAMRAYDNAAADVALGRTPLISDDCWLMPSATRSGLVHRVRQAGGVWLCSCEATAFCWHAAMVATVERAIDMLEQGLLGDGDDGDDGSGPIVVTGGAGGLSLSRGDVAIECQAPEQVAEAIGTLLGRRLAAARARLAA